MPPRRKRRSRSDATPPPPGSGAGRWIVLAALFLGLAMVAWWALRERGLGILPRADQNVLLVTIDSLRADALSIAGGDARTPVIDRLAREGVRFTFAHTHAVTTRAAHASLLTGRLPYEHGVRDDRGYRLAPDAATMASRLTAAGYATGGFVGAGLLSRQSGLDAGFGVYDDRMATRADPLSPAIPERPADAVVRSALNWIGQQPDRWFAWVHLFEPHAPYAPPAADGPPQPSTPYLQEVAAADAALGPLLAGLRDEVRPTLVILTADHGEGLGDHLEETHGLFGYETTLHVPLIMASIEPATDPRGGGFTVDAPARLIDVLPTVLAALDLPADAGLPGRSLDPVMRGEETERRPTYFEAMSAALMREWAPLRGVIDGRDKLIALPIAELYDLSADPGELRNQAQLQPARRAELEALLASFDVAPPAPPADTGPEVLAHLRSLGFARAEPRPDTPPTEDTDPKRLVDLDQLMDAGIVAYEEGRFDDAATALQQVILGRPRNAEAYLQLALVFWQGGLPDQAIATLRAAVNVGLTQGGVRLKLARMLALASGGPAAIQLLEGRLPPETSVAYLEALGALGIAYTQVGRMADAERTFDTMIATAPGSAVAYENLGTLRLRQNRLGDAETLLRRAISLEPLTSGAYTALGVTLSEQGRLSEAIDVWTQAVQLGDGEYLALFNLTFALASEGRTEEARLRGEQFLRTAPPTLYADQISQVRNLLGGR